MSYSSVSSTATVTFAEALAKIDAEIDALQTRVYELRTTRNAMLPISCLPFEILSRIFSFVGVEGGGSFEVPIIVPVAQVSRHWRQVALEDPMLWTCIDKSNLRRANLFIERSKKLGLSICLDTSDIYDYDLEAEHISEAFDRVKDLTLACESRRFRNTDSDIDIYRAPFLDTPRHAPLLERLSLYDLQLPSAISSTTAPKLQILELVRSNFSWITLRTHCPKLTTLRLERPVQGIVLHDLRDLLEATPLLQHLVLVDIQLSHTEVNLDPVHLHSLTTLKIEFRGLGPALPLYECLILPQTTDRALRIPVHQSEIEGLSAVFSSITKHFDSANPIQFFDVADNIRGSLHLELRTAGTAGRAILKIASTSAYTSTTLKRDALDKALKELPLKSVKGFSFETGHPFDTWVRDLGHMTSLELLRVSDFAAVSFFRFLVSKPRVEENLLELFPELKVLKWMYAEHDVELHEGDVSAFCRAAHVLYPRGCPPIPDLSCRLYQSSATIDSGRLGQLLKNWRVLSGQEDSHPQPKLEAPTDDDFIGSRAI
ncbi:hypothetical protein BDN72DRAFT_924155 [Pluteus cervinus]|uniref:Uncharacterized protein n=1 Tax=Pluteus cervinus TaxID=181527 RepID=A0ACD3AFV6_9AGAR|nr:hypothetical protein BDN72DRAFT_924155 [Pluteus cervinus]